MRVIAQRARSGRVTRGSNHSTDGWRARTNSHQNKWSEMPVTAGARVDTDNPSGAGRGVISDRLVSGIVRPGPRVSAGPTRDVR